MSPIRQLELKDFDISFDLEEEKPQGEKVISPQEAQMLSEIARTHLEENAQNVKWLEDYKFLYGLGWPWRVAVYIAWKSSPKLSRWPKTQFELATICMGLNSDRVIFTWIRKNPAILKSISMMQSHSAYEYRADWFEALAISAANPGHEHAPDRRTAFTMSQDYVQHQKIEVERSKADPLDMSDAELEEDIKNEEAIHRAEKGDTK